MNLKKRRGTVQALCGLPSVSGNTIATDRGTHQYFLLQPVSLTVLPQEALQQRIRALMPVLEQIPDWEWICVDAREHCSSNRRYLQNRLEKEPEETVRNQLRQMLGVLEDSRKELAASRKFLLSVPTVPGKDPGSVNTLLSGLEAQGFTVVSIGEEELLQILEEYHGLESEHL